MVAYAGRSLNNVSLSAVLGTFPPLTGYSPLFFARFIVGVLRFEYAVTVPFSPVDGFTSICICIIVSMVHTSKNIEVSCTGTPMFCIHDGGHHIPGYIHRILMVAYAGRSLNNVSLSAVLGTFPPLIGFSPLFFARFIV